MKLTLAGLLLFIATLTQAQTFTSHLVSPVGVYKEIDLSKDIRIIELLSDTNYAQRFALVDSVERFANVHTPPVLYVLSYNLFQAGKKAEAAYWFYLAQLRARYDVNRCTDKTATAVLYNDNFGPPINQWAKAHLDTLILVVGKVIAYARANPEAYDQRWINLSGMAAIMAALDNKTVAKPLSVAQNKWPAIKKTTIDDYEEGFKGFVEQVKKMH